MEIQTNFQIISDEELSEIVGGGYPNNQSMNDVLHWLNGHNDGNPKQLPKWMCGLGWIRLTKYIYPNLKDNQKYLLKIIDGILTSNNISSEEKKLFLIAKSNIEKGRNFDPQISELISSLQYLVHSDAVLVFFEEARKIMQINPGTGGSPYGWSNFESK